MEIPKIITQLQKPLQKKRKLFVLVIVLVLILGGIGAAYYFHLESEKERLILYKTQQFDNYFQKLTRKLDNDQLIITSRNPEKEVDNEFIIDLKNSLLDLESDIKKNLESNPKVTPEIDSVIEKKVDNILKSKINEIIEQKTEQLSKSNPEQTEDKTIKADCNFIKSTTRPCLDEFVEKRLNFKKDFDEYIIKINNKTSVNANYSSSFDGLNEEILIDSIEQKKWVTIKSDLLIDHEKYLILGKRFSYKLSPESQFEVTFYGLTTEENFKQQVNQLDPALVALLITILIILIIGLPFLKMVFISEDERLYSSDVLFAGLSTILGAPVLLILLLSTIHYYTDFNQKRESLLNLAHGLKENFEKENSEIVKRASNFNYKGYRSENDVKYRYFEGDNEENVKERNKELFRQFQFTDYDSINGLDINYFKYVSEIYSSDTIVNDKPVKMGDVRYHVNYMAKPPAGMAPWNLSSRIYFKDLKANTNVWNKDGINYVMRPVVSIENSSEEAVYALNIPSSKKEPATMGIFAVQLKSLHTTSLPIGYQFAVINDAGEVWFHSEPGKTTLENLFSNSTDDKKLEAGILGRIKAEGTFNYHGEKKLYSSLPIKGTDLSVVTFYDIELIGLQTTEVLSITTILLLMLAVFMAFVVIVSVLLKNPKWGLYKFYSFPFQFLLPKRKFLKAYQFLTIFYVVLFLILAFTRVSDINFSFNYILGVIIFYWSFMLSYYVLKPERDKRKLNLANTSFFVITFLLNLLFLSIVNDDMSYILLIQALFLIPIVLTYFKWFRVYIYPEEKSNSDGQSKSIRYKYSYVNFLAVWLFSSTLIPAFIFFENSRHINDAVWDRADLFEYLDHRQKKEKFLRSDILKPIAKKDFNDSIFQFNLYNFAHHNLINSHLKKGNYYPEKSTKNDLPYYVFNDALNNLKSAPINISTHSLVNEFVWHIRPIFKEKSRQYQHFSRRKAEDAIWISQKKGDTLSFQLNCGDQNPCPTAQYVSNNNSRRFFDLFITDEKRYGILNLLGILTIFGSFYWLILFYVDRCFAFRFFYLNPSLIDKRESLGKSYAEELAKLISNSKANSGLFMIGLPSTGKQTFAEILYSEYIKIIQQERKIDIKEIAKKNPCFTLSCSLLSTCSKDDDLEKILKKIVVTENADFQNCDDPFYIIQNFEHNLLSFEESHLKVKLISYLIARKSRLVITSEIYPNQLTDVYRDQIDETGELKAELASDYNSWRDILGRFHQILVGITKQDELVTKSVKDIDFTEYKDGSLELLKEEFGHSKYLPSLSPTLLKKCTYSRISNDKAILMIDGQRMVLHTMMTAHGYYTDIWNSLPRREKYILFDIAKDGFMNIKNSISLFSLMKKGLIVWDDIPRIFNKSFRNFIISNGEKDIVLSKERRNTGGQNWGTTKIILMVIIMAIIVFIVIGNPGIVKNLESFIGALAGLGALIPILSSLLGKSRKTE